MISTMCNCYFQNKLNIFLIVCLLFFFNQHFSADIPSFLLMRKHSEQSILKMRKAHSWQVAPFLRICNSAHIKNLFKELCLIRYGNFQMFKVELKPARPPTRH